jgi:hypothetical protein
VDVLLSDWLQPANKAIAAKGTINRLRFRIIEADSFPKALRHPPLFAMGPNPEDCSLGCLQ